MGHDVTGSIQEFDADGNILEGGAKLRECFFMNFARLLSKDEIKKGSFELELGVTDVHSQQEAANTTGPFLERIKLTDASGSDGFFVNSPAGEYGILYAETSDAISLAANAALIHVETVIGNASTATTRPAAGLIFYQAGIAVISGSVFNKNTVDAGDPGVKASSGILDDVTSNHVTLQPGGVGTSGFNVVSGSSIESVCNSIRNRIYNVKFNNSTELNSSIYFCRINHNDFNYSSNPTYLSGSKIRVKNSTVDNPVTYLTTIGLYSADNELLAVAKLSEPLKKDPSTEMTLRVRLDY
jgi:hypothetical protein